MRTSLLRNENWIPGCETHVGVTWESFPGNRWPVLQGGTSKSHGQSWKLSKASAVSVRTWSHCRSGAWVASPLTSQIRPRVTGRTHILCPGCGSTSPPHTITGNTLEIWPLVREQWRKREEFAFPSLSKPRVKRILIVSERLVGPPV